MKTINKLKNALVLALLSPLVACSSTINSIAPEPNLSLRQRVQQNYESFATGNLDNFVQNIADDFIWRSNYPNIVPFGGDFVGATGVRDIASLFERSINVSSFNLYELTLSDSMVIVSGCEQGQVLENGVEYTNQWIHQWQFDVSDKVTLFRSFNDSEAVAQAFRGEVASSEPCQAASTTALPANPSLVSQVQANYAAFGMGELDTLLLGFKPNFIWESRYANNVPFSGTYLGSDGFFTYLSDLSGAIEILEFNPQHFASAGNVVVVLGFERARVTATGELYTNVWAHRWQFENGLVEKFTSFNDSATVAAAFRF